MTVTKKIVLSDEEVAEIRALVRGGHCKTRNAVAEHLGYRAKTFNAICARDIRVNKAMKVDSTDNYHELAKTTPKMRDRTKPGRRFAEIKTKRLPDVEFWACVYADERLVIDELHISKDNYYRQKETDPRIDEALELGFARHKWMLRDRIMKNGRDQGLIYLAKSIHGAHDSAPSIQDNRTQTVIQLNMKPSDTEAEFRKRIE